MWLVARGGRERRSGRANVPTGVTRVGPTLGDVETESRGRSPDILTTTDERVLLEVFLDDQRERLTDLISGLTETEVRRRLVPSATTLMGLIRHGAAVERFFFQRTLLGLAPEQIAGPSDATDIS